VAVVAGTGLGSAFIGGWWAGRAANRTNKANTEQLLTRLEHERNMAREERQQDRKGQAYLELLKYVHRLGQSFAHRQVNIERVAAAVSVGPEDVEDEAELALRALSAANNLEEDESISPLPQEARESVVALVTAFGSVDVRGAFDALVTTRVTAATSAEMVYMLAKVGPQPTGFALTHPEQTLANAYDDLAAAVSAIRALVRRELQGEGQ
jgi:hypothetical protein